MLQAIAGAEISAAERKYLRRRAVEVAAASGGGGGACDVLGLYEGLFARAAELAGSAIGAGRLRRCLLLAGRPDLAKRAVSLSRARRAAAHPDVGLTAEVTAALAGFSFDSCSSSGSGSGSGSGSEDEQAGLPAQAVAPAAEFFDLYGDLEEDVRTHDVGVQTPWPRPPLQAARRQRHLRLRPRALRRPMADPERAERAPSAEGRP